MRFLGIDLGWQGKPSGVAVLDWTGHSLSLAEMNRLDSHKDVLAWVDQFASHRDALVAVDAPTIISNLSGMRDADRLMHNLYGKYHAGAYPANKQSPFASLTTRFGQELVSRGFEHATDIVPRKPGRYQIEVYPHAAIVELFDLQRIIKYKKGRVSQRFSELSRYRDMLAERLPSIRPSLPLPLSSLPHFERRGPEMKAAEDRMDAIICAYIGAYWWYWGIEGGRVYGSLEGGYIVVPCRDFVQTTND